MAHYNLRVVLKTKEEDTNIQKTIEKKKPKSSSERAKEYKTNLKKDPEKYAKYLKEQAQRNRINRLHASEEKKIRDRETGRERSRQYRIRQKQLKEAEPFNITPKRPITRKELMKKRALWRENKKKQRANMGPQKKRRLLEKRRKNYQDKKLLKSTPSPTVFLTDSAKRKATSRARMTLPKEPEKFATVIKTLVTQASPRKKKALLKHSIGTISNIKKKPILHCLAEQINALKELRMKKDIVQRRELAKAFTVMKKYRQLRPISKLLGIGYSYLIRCSHPPKKQGRAPLHKDLVEKVTSFYVRPDISTELPTKRSVSLKTLTQKSILDKSIKKLYADFKEENKDAVLSFSKFNNLRPNNVLLQRSRRLNQCLCEFCANIELKIVSLNVFTGKRAPDCKILDKYHCLNISLCQKVEEFNNIDCINRLCSNCGISCIDRYLHNLIECSDKEETIVWHHWENKKITFIKDGKETEIIRKQLVRKRELLIEFLLELKNELFSFSSHLFVAKWQYSQYNFISKNIPEEWTVLIMDFAENYTCFFQDEIQSLYWYHQQVTVHPIIAFYACPDIGCDEIIRESIVLFSDDLKHDSEAVNHFLTITNQYLLTRLNIKHQVQWSDGCGSQYKSKYPFKDIANSVVNHGFTVERHFFGSRHGKGPCDGLGGVIKCAATRAVTSKTAIVSNAEEMFNFCSENLVIEDKHTPRVFFFVKQGDIIRQREDMKTIKGTQRLHAVKGVTPKTIQTRNLSCFCTFCVTGQPLCENYKYVNKWSTVPLSCATSFNLQIAKCENLTGNIQQSCPSDENLVTMTTNPADILNSLTDISYTIFNNKKIEVDKYYVVRWGNKEKLWMAKIESLDLKSNLVELNFMHEDRNGGYFWPSEEDISWETLESIIEIKNDPILDEKNSSNRRQTFKFL